MSSQLSLMVKPELLAELKRAAEAEEVSVSQIVRRTLRQHFPPSAPTADSRDDRMGGR